jgi:alpha-amylase
MASVCFYFQVHQPLRLRRYSVFDTDRHYFDDYKNGEILRKVASKCYLPANKMLLDVIKMHEGRFRVAFSVTGMVLEQLQQHVPEVLETFQQLSKTGCVEFLSETYYHSLAFLYSREEFRAQVDLHRAKIKELFGQEPRVFRNTELIYNNDLAQFISHMGYDGILTEGADQILGYRSPNFAYKPPHAAKIKVLLKNYRLDHADQRQRISVQSVPRLRNLRRASVGRYRHLRFHAPSAWRSDEDVGREQFFNPQPGDRQVRVSG